MAMITEVVTDFLRECDTFAQVGELVVLLIEEDRELRDFVANEANLPLLRAAIARGCAGAADDVARLFLRQYELAARTLSSKPERR